MPDLRSIGNRGGFSFLSVLIARSSAAGSYECGERKRAAATKALAREMHYDNTGKQDSNEAVATQPPARMSTGDRYLTPVI
jgi:hypothetical protein